MKKQGMLNSHITKVLTDLGHTDMIVIADAGLPVPDGVLKIDLALTLGKPSFQETVEAIAADMMIEKITLAKEIDEANQPASAFMEAFFSSINMERVTHEELKEMTKQAKAVIRTGEATPYANCILHAGVIF